MLRFRRDAAMHRRVRRHAKASVPPVWLKACTLLCAAVPTTSVPVPERLRVEADGATDEGVNMFGTAKLSTVFPLSTAPLSTPRHVDDIRIPSREVHVAENEPALLIDRHRATGARH